MLKIKEVNPYAICRAMAKKHNWSEDKTQRCIEKVKAKNIAIDIPKKRSEGTRTVYVKDYRQSKEYASMIVNRPRVVRWWA